MKVRDRDRGPRMRLIIRRPGSRARRDQQREYRPRGNSTGLRFKIATGMVTGCLQYDLSPRLLGMRGKCLTRAVQIE